MLRKETRLLCVIRIQGPFKIRSCLLFSYCSMLKILLFLILCNRNFGLREISHGGGGLITIFKPTLWKVKKAETGGGMQTSNQGDLTCSVSVPWAFSPVSLLCSLTPATKPSGLDLKHFSKIPSQGHCPGPVSTWDNHSPPDSHGLLLHFLTFFRSLLQGCFLSEAFTDHLS